MKNALNYYYGISVSDIYKKDQFYYFYYQERKYILYKHDLNETQLEQVEYMNYQLIMNGIKMHRIIKSNNNISITYQDSKYILMLVECDEEEPIGLDQIIDFNNRAYTREKPLDYKSLWSQKIDYIEYQVSEMGKEYEIIRDSINYFVGLAENAIALSGYIKNYSCSISHRKFSEEPLEFYNPLNLIVDYRVRDISEYFKQQILRYKFNLSLFINSMTGLLNDEVLLVFQRIMFPNYYFDFIQKSILEEHNDYKIKSILENIPYFYNQLICIYELFDYFPYIDWIKKT